MTESSVAAAGTGKDKPKGFDIVEPSASGRVRIIPAPVASPGCCVICGKSDHPKGFAATDNLDFEFYGTLYFCYDCVGEYASAFGYISSEDLGPMRNHLESQEIELRTLRAAVLGLEGTVDNLVADAHRRNKSTSDTVTRVDKHDRDVYPDIAVDEPDAGPPSESLGESIATVQSREQRPAQQVDKQRRNDVLDTSTADELLGL